MKVLFQYLYGGGGAVENIKILCRALADRDEVTSLVVVCSPDSALAELVGHPKVRVVKFGPYPIRELNRLTLGLWSLNSIVRREKPDVVVSMNLSAYFPLAAPSVLTINNAYQVYPRAITAYHPKRGLGVLVLRAFFRRSLRFVDGVVVQTGLMKRYVCELLNRPMPVWVIPKAVENETDLQLQPLSDEIVLALARAPRPSRFRFLYVATASGHKNHRLLYSAMELARRRGIDLSLLLTLTESEISQTGGELGSSLVSSGHVIPVGFVSKSQLKALYEAADACVMPSLLESLSSANLEAMEWERPQIAADLPYARDLCEDAALYCSPFDPEAWADSMAALAHSETLRRDLVARGRQVSGRLPRSVHQAAGLLVSALQATIDRYHTDQTSFASGIDKSDRS